MTKLDVEIFNAIRFKKAFVDGDTEVKVSAKGVKVLYAGECIFKKHDLKNKWTVTVSAKSAAGLISRLNACLLAVDAPVTIKTHAHAFVVVTEDGVEHNIPGSSFNQHYVEELLDGTLATYLH